jgi:hypothetical protein
MNDVFEVARNVIVRNALSAANRGGPVAAASGRTARRGREGVLTIHRGVQLQGPERLRGQFRPRLRSSTQPSQSCALQRRCSPAPRGRKRDPGAAPTAGRVAGGSLASSRRRAQGREILCDPGGVLALLDDMLDQVIVHAGADRIGSAAPDLVQRGLHQGHAGAREAMRAKQHLRIELRHVAMVHDRVARLAELRFGQADLQPQDRCGNSVRLEQERDPAPRPSRFSLFQCDQAFDIVVGQIADATLLGSRSHSCR